MTPFKICGITRLEDAQTAAKAGAWAIGFIFQPASPRCVQPAQVRPIVEAMPAQLLKVGVIVDLGLEEIMEISSASGLQAFQLHGDESPELARQVAERFTVIKAFRPRAESDLRSVASFSGIQHFLVDAYVEGAYGGTGRQTNPQWIAPLRRFGKVGLAGGITPLNAAELARVSQADFIDVSSGVEDRPGIKNAGKIQQLAASLRGGSK